VPERVKTDLSSAAAALSPSTATPTLDIVIVNWNAGTYLRDCLRSIAEARRSTFDLGHVVLVDNASDDGSIDNLGELALPLRVLRNADNRGFAAACNQGARAGNANLLLFLNPDTRLFPNTLDLSVAFMADPGNSDIGICGGQMVGADGTREVSCSRFPTLIMLLAKMTKLSDVFPQWFPAQRVAPTEMESSGVVDQVIGAYFLIRRSLFEALHGFDERFFMYMEDVDLSYRANQLGYASQFLADVRVHHKGNVSSEQIHGARLFYVLRSRTEYARKHWPAWKAVVLAILSLTIEIPARAMVAAGRHDDITGVAKAAWLYCRYLLTAISTLPRPAR
jgi:N-acetylglucosaminyl-diphospho-decaprenol L-rhamnosyltransferase